MYFMFTLGQKCPYILVTDIYAHPQSKKQYHVQYVVPERVYRNVLALYLILSYYIFREGFA